LAVNLTLAGLFAFGTVFAAMGCSRTPAAARAPAIPHPTDAVAVTYLGVAGWQLTHAGNTLLLDPYFTRASVGANWRPLLPDTDAIARFAPPTADVILVGHSHYDHLLDVPSIALRTAATVVGTASTLNVARAAGVPEARLQLAVPGRAFRFHTFSICPVASLHSLNGIPSVDIPRNVRHPLSARDYGEGGTLAYAIDVGGRSLFLLDTANFDDAALRSLHPGLHPDVAVIATALREKITDYTCRLMRLLGDPPVVFPTHFDAHWEPLTAKETRLTDEQRADLAEFVQEVHACSPGTRVVVPEAFRPYPI
jgi:L-ascorbate metabolism protein UlaG (beta-lactamase superfamily)